MEHRDCACVLVGQKYSWDYVDRLYSMLNRHSSIPVRLHVLTESGRHVPQSFVRHDIQVFPEINGPSFFWWYKMQLFRNSVFESPIMYFDLDTVILSNIDFLWQGSTAYFWCVRDFRYLWKPACFEINSSVMYWDPKKFHWVWDDFCQKDYRMIIKKYPGDQNYLDAVIPRDRVRFFDEDLIKSWRWQVQDGGWDFARKKPRDPGTTLSDNTHKILIFHGTPKPHQVVSNNLVAANWK